MKNFWLTPFSSFYEFVIKLCVLDFNNFVIELWNHFLSKKRDILCKIFCKIEKKLGFLDKKGDKTHIFQHKNRKCPMKIELDIDISGVSR